MFKKQLCLVLCLLLAFSTIATNVSAATAVDNSLTVSSVKFTYDGTVLASRSDMPTGIGDNITASATISNSSVEMKEVIFWLGKYVNDVLVEVNSSQVTITPLATDTPVSATLATAATDIVDGSNIATYKAYVWLMPNDGSGFIGAQTVVKPAVFPAPTDGSSDVLIVKDGKIIGSFDPTDSGRVILPRAEEADYTLVSQNSQYAVSDTTIDEFGEHVIAVAKPDGTTTSSTVVAKTFLENQPYNIYNMATMNSGGVYNSDTNAVVKPTGTAADIIMSEAVYDPYAPSLGYQMGSLMVEKFVSGTSYLYTNKTDNKVTFAGVDADLTHIIRKPRYSNEESQPGSETVNGVSISSQTSTWNTRYYDFDPSDTETYTADPAKYAEWTTFYISSPATVYFVDTVNKYKSDGTPDGVNFAAGWEKGMANGWTLVEGRYAFANGYNKVYKKHFDAGKVTIPNYGRPAELAGTTPIAIKLSTSPVYLVEFDAAPSNDATLSSVTVNGAAATLSAGAYSIELEGGTTQATVVATPTDDGASVVIKNGNDEVTGPIAVSSAAATELTITVTAEDGTTAANYTLTITVDDAPPPPPSDVKTLSSLTVNGTEATLSEGAYSITLPKLTTQATVVATPTALSDGARAVIKNGNDEVTAPIAVSSAAATELTITVTAEDGTTADYTLTITVEAIPANTIYNMSTMNSSGVYDKDAGTNANSKPTLTASSITPSEPVYNPYSPSLGDQAGGTKVEKFVSGTSYLFSNKTDKKVTFAGVDAERTYIIRKSRYSNEETYTGTETLLGDVSVASQSTLWNSRYYDFDISNTTTYTADASKYAEWETFYISTPATVYFIDTMTPYFANGWTKGVANGWTLLEGRTATANGSDNRVYSKHFEAGKVTIPNYGRPAELAGTTPQIMKYSMVTMYLVEFDGSSTPVTPPTPTTYTITWKNDDGSIIDTTTVAQGEMPTHADATKAATAEYTYTFAGWTPAVVAATADAEYMATYTSTPVTPSTPTTYTITWKNDDGSIIDTTTVAQGEMPTHADATKAATAEYTYTFAGWTPAVVAATADAEYTATYTSTPVTPSIAANKIYDMSTYNNAGVYDGTAGAVVKPTGDWQNTSTITPSTAVANPYAATQNAVTGGVVVDKFTNQVSSIGSNNVTYKLSFQGDLANTIDDDYSWIIRKPTEKTNERYQYNTSAKAENVPVDFNGDGSSDGYYIKIPNRTTAWNSRYFDFTRTLGTNNTEAATTYLAWDSFYISSPATVYFVDTVNKYSDTSGGVSSVPFAAGWQKGLNNGWSFVGWAHANGYHKVYSKHFEAGLVTIPNYGRPQELLDVTIEEIAQAAGVDTTVKLAASKDVTLANIQTAGLTVEPAMTPVYLVEFDGSSTPSTPTTYTITWKNDDGSIIDTTTVAQGEMPTHADATKAATAEYTYTFAGWTPAVVAATADAEYTATYTSTPVTPSIAANEIYNLSTMNSGGIYDASTGTAVKDAVVSSADAATSNTYPGAIVVDKYTSGSSMAISTNKNPFVISNGDLQINEENTWIIRKPRYSNEESYNKSETITKADASTVSIGSQKSYWNSRYFDFDATQAANGYENQDNSYVAWDSFYISSPAVVYFVDLMNTYSDTNGTATNEKFADGWVKGLANGWRFVGYVKAGSNSYRKAYAKQFQAGLVTIPNYGRPQAIKTMSVDDAPTLGTIGQTPACYLVEFGGSLTPSTPIQ